MAKRDQDVHFLASKEEVERIHEKMDELGILSERFTRHCEMLSIKRSSGN